ncbi:MAG: hypothetical protein E3K36_08750 [Candidatus Brocadia sp.]|nr:hypothetical protein [Candidatus Brocadia sp.]
MVKRNSVFINVFSLRPLRRTVAIFFPFSLLNIFDNALSLKIMKRFHGVAIPFSHSNDFFAVDISLKA